MGGTGEAGLFCWVGRTGGEHQGWKVPIPASPSMAAVQSMIKTGLRAYAQYDQQVPRGAQRMHSAVAAV